MIGNVSSYLKLRIEPNEKATVEELLLLHLQNGLGVACYNLEL